MMIIRVLIPDLAVHRSRDPSNRPTVPKRSIWWKSKPQQPPNANVPPPKPPPPEMSDSKPFVPPDGSMSAEMSEKMKQEIKEKLVKSVTKEIDGIKHVVAVASGKGGVGKSTVAVNLALALSLQNKRVGLVDVDIYGPSIPTLMNIDERPEVSEEDESLIPHIQYGIKVMSMGFLIPKDAATIWRGPMVMNAVNQLINNVKWGELDVLVADLPPGTGDTQLSLSQRARISGAVIVSTAQDVALADVRRGVNMFRTVNVPILGIIENMSHFECPCCGTQYELFGKGGAEKAASDLGVDFLGQLPFIPDVRVLSDAGKPIVISKPESSAAKSFNDLAAKIITKLDRIEKAPPKRLPKIVFE